MNDRTITRVGITGASGHIGTTVSEGLADSYTLTLFHHRREIRQDLASKFKSIKVDFSQARSIKDIFEGLDAVIHLAADPLTDAPWESVLNNNIVATYNVFEEARRANVSKIVFASTNHTQHDYVGKTPLTLDRFYVKTTDISSLMTLQRLTHSMLSPNFSVKTWAGTIHEGSASSSLPCASGRHFLRMTRQSGKEPSVKTMSGLYF